MMVSSLTGVLHGIIVNVQGDTVTSQAGRHSSGFNPLPYRVPTIFEIGADHYFSVLAYEQAVRIPATLNMTPYLSCEELR